MKKLSSLIIIGLFGFGVFWFYQNYISALHYSLSPNSEARMVINIKQGSSAAAIADLLLEKGLIKNSFAFKIYLKQNNLADQLKAGRIVLQEGFDLKQIVDALIEGKSEEMPVTLLEGWTAEQIAEHLESIGLTTKEEFMDCLSDCELISDILPNGYVEGYLYPDTYFVNFNTYSDQSFINRLVSTLEIKLDDDDWAAIEAGNHTFEEIIIMASIVEREERNESEQPTVAGILWDRFDNGLGLGADATVLYALGRTKGGLTYNDLQIDSPYNTRKYRGLPPTPISNPGISSILAAIYPKKTNYSYYLHGSDGVIHYAETLDGHNANKRDYL